jgi:DNA mismatch repair ATPase MutL
VCAKNLFKNLPVRKQVHNATKKKKEDLKNIENLLLAYSVILPNVRFTLRHNKETVWQKLVLESRAAVFQSIVGKAVMKQMEWKHREVEELGVSMLFLFILSHIFPTLTVVFCFHLLS